MNVLTFNSFHTLHAFNPTVFEPDVFGSIVNQRRPFGKRKITTGTNRMTREQIVRAAVIETLSTHFSAPLSAQVRVIYCNTASRTQMYT